MKCASARNLIEPHLDGELNPDLQARIQDHLAACDPCNEAFSRLRELQTNIRTQLPHYDAPAHFRERVLESLREVAKHGAADGGGTRWSLPWRWMAIAASALLAVSVAGNVTLFQARSGGLDIVTQNVLSSHVRSLIGTHLLDVPSSDQHTVKPWFNGRLDYAPPVEDLAASGFTLVGGRLDYVGHRRVAVLTYHYHKHVLDVYVFPETDPGAESPASTLVRDGYSLARWHDDGMVWWAITDAAPDSLAAFKVALNARLHGGARSEMPG